LGVPSIEDVFTGIFLDMLKSGNFLAIIGLITSIFVGLILLFDSIAVVFGFRNLGNLLEEFGYEED
jgi:hypothetical protein